MEFHAFHFLQDNQTMDSFWRYSFHYWSIFLSRTMWDLCSMIGSACLNGFKSMESLLLVGQYRIKIVHNEGYLSPHKAPERLYFFRDHNTPSTLHWAHNLLCIARICTQEPLAKTPNSQSSILEILTAAFLSYISSNQCVSRIVTKPDSHLGLFICLQSCWILNYVSKFCNLLDQ